MTRQKLNQVLAVVLTVGLLPMSAHAASVTFTDVSPDAWYYEDVTYVTRGEWAQVMYNLGVTQAGQLTALKNQGGTIG